ncbi:hypothetical protein Hanom_Chr04g00373231 [Helianthus anomalus]
MPPMEPIFPQEDWNIEQEIIISTKWDDLPPECPLNALHEVPVVVATPPQNVVDDEPILFLP